MSAISRPEFFTDIILTIDETHFKDTERLEEILKRKDSCCYEKKGSCYTVKGPFEELDKLVERCINLQHHSTATRGGPGQHNHHTSTVEVSQVVMHYIQQKCAEKLRKILGNHLVIEKQSDTTVRITFRPQSDSLHQAAFARQRFITFYQRVASDLHIISVPVNLHDHNQLQKTFPNLIFETSNKKHELTVMGPFPHIAKFKEFLLKNPQSSTKRPVNKTLTDSRSNRISGSSSTHKEPDDESCPICMETIATNKKTTLRCKHSFCSECLKKAFVYKPVCPTCGELYGALKGTQPDGGTMKVTRNSSSLSGYERYGTIVIHYYIPSGIQKEEHPNPGQPYEGASRTAYLPDSSEGRMVLELLRRAFDQRLIFTIGRSTTSGRNNTVTWNDIHHKTSTHGGPTHYGYPDPEYLRRVRDELKVKGIE